MACVFSALALTLGFGAVTLQSAAGGRGELSTGLAPVAPATPAEPSVAVMLEPFAASRLRLDRHFLTWRYSPRLLLRQPNLADRIAPLLMHRSDAVLHLLLSRRATARAGAQAYYGEVEYNRIDLVLAEASVTLPRRAVVPVAGYAPFASLSYAFTRRYEVTLAGSGSRGGPIRRSDRRELSTTTRATGELEQSLQVTRIDEAVLRTSVSSVDLDPGRALELAAADLGWHRALSAASSASLAAGITGFRTRGSSDAPEFFPTGRASVTGPLRIVHGRPATGEASVGLQGSPDAISGGYLPTLSAAAALRVSFNPWTTYVQVSVAGAASMQPRYAEPRESRGAAGVGAQLPLRAGVELELGLRASVWGSHWAAREFELSNHELWGFAAVSFIIPAGRGNPSWAR